MGRHTYFDSPGLEEDDLNMIAEAFIGSNKDKDTETEGNASKGQQSNTEPENEGKQAIDAQNQNILEEGRFKKTESQKRAPSQWLSKEKAKEMHRRQESFDKGMALNSSSRTSVDAEGFTMISGRKRPPAKAPMTSSFSGQSNRNFLNFLNKTGFTKTENNNDPKDKDVRRAPAPYTSR
ncbi:hypothetical protein ABFS83_07G108500 [Erythranthe nasuta]